jgi:hypothetical protein
MWGIEGVEVMRLFDRLRFRVAARECWEEPAGKE